MSEVKPVDWQDYQKILERVFGIFFLFGAPLLFTLLVSVLIRLDLFQWGLMVGIWVFWWVAVYIVVIGKPFGVKGT